MRIITKQVDKVPLYENKVNTLPDKFSLPFLLNENWFGYYAWLNSPSNSATLIEYINKQYWYHKANTIRLQRRVLSEILARIIEKRLD